MDARTEAALAADPSLRKHAKHWVAEALPLITIHEEDGENGRKHHTFHVGDAAANVLAHVPAPVSVVAVVGACVSVCVVATRP